MADQYEDCRRRLQELAIWYEERKGDRNEATTRLHLIDTLFLECLGWTKDDVQAEETQEGKYTDYTFMAPRRLLIVEAKREGEYFELPAGTHGLERSIPGLCRDYPDIKKAMAQVAEYCQKRGVEFGAACNGHQLIAFIACRGDGIAPMEGRALVFPSLDRMIEDFLMLWDALSKPGIQEKRLLSRLVGGQISRVPAKLAASVTNYPGIKGRNPFQTDLQIVSELVMEDVAKSPQLEEKFLRECYCQGGALSQHSVLAKQILQARYAAVFEPDVAAPTILSATNKDGISPELLAESISRRPIILLGDTGVGKTTFSRNLIKVEAADIFENGIAIYIDLGARGILAMDLRAFVLDEVDRQLRRSYDIDIYERNFVKAIYNLELERFRRSIYGDLERTDRSAFSQREIAFLEGRLRKKEEHIRHALQHITRGQNKPVVFFLDNADQRTEDVQEQAFLIAQEIAEAWPVTVFLALRPTTFHRSLRSGSLSGYHPKAFVISPPRVDRVLQKRLEFCIQMASGKIPLESLGARVSIQLHAMEKIMRSFLLSLEHTHGLIELIDNLAGGNIRLALDLVRQFFGSGHVDTQKIVERYDQSGTYYVPLHEFLRAVIYGDTIHYDPRQSYIANVFDVGTLDPKEHFLVPILIGFLDVEGRKAGAEGFVGIARIYDRLQGVGFTAGQIDLGITRSVKKRLIETGGRKVPEIKEPMPETLRASSVGVYHVRCLTRLFSYVDAMIVDTPILDPAVRGQVTEVQSLDQRLERAEIFRGYLNEQWALFSRLDGEYDWIDASRELHNDIDRVQNYT